ncbi:MAG: ribonuclease P protein component [Candidatus Aminicenantes bacterium]|nr:ribonuclease P protein component [Candidatus Aminicenantes bacterium]
MDAQARVAGAEPDFFLYCLRSSRPYHRFAVSVNRRVGNAVQRNYTKRVMKELFRNHGGLLRDPHDVWVVIKKRFGRDERDQVERLYIDALISANYRE